MLCFAVCGLDEAELGLVVWAGKEVGGCVAFWADDRGQVSVFGASHGLHTAGGAEVGGVAAKAWSGDVAPVTGGGHSQALS